MPRIAATDVPDRPRKDLTGFLEAVVDDKPMFRRFLAVGDATELGEFFWNEGFTEVDDVNGIWQARMKAKDGMTFTFESIAAEGGKCY